MKAIYIDSCSAKLLVIAVNGDKVASSQSDGVSLRHNNIILPFLDKVLCDVGLAIGDVEHIACAVGAGSFTGIRLGVTTCNGLSFSTGAKRISMNTFESIAYNTSVNTLVLIDARHGNYFGGEYDGGLEVRLSNYTDEDINTFDGDVIVWDGEHITSNIINVMQRKIAKSDFVDQLIPLYLKKSQAEREAECL